LGNTLAAPAGVGGNANLTSTGAAGANGSIKITYATVGAEARNTQNTAALVIGTSSDGSRTFNPYTIVQIVNNGSIVGAPDNTPRRTGLTSIVVNEGQTTVEFDIAGGGGTGGQGDHGDRNGPGRGGRGGNGQHKTGSVGVSEGDSLSISIGGSDGATICYHNGQHAGYAGPGGRGGTAGNAGKDEGDGGAGGAGGGYTDGGKSGAGGAGSGGWGSMSYQPNLAGGPAIFHTAFASVVAVPTTLQNNNTIRSGGGVGSYNTKGSGYAIIGNQYITTTSGPNGTIFGALG